MAGLLGGKFISWRVQAEQFGATSTIEYFQTYPRPYGNGGSVMSKHQGPATKLYLEVEARQRNTTWPDALRNASSVDGLIFKGSAEATTLQRIGVAVFGALYIAVSIATIMIAWEQRSKFVGFMASLEFLLGAKVVSNAFVRRKASKVNHHPHRIPPGHQ